MHPSLMRMHACRCNVADPDVGGMSRWEELKQTLSICLEAHAAVGCACDVYFINRGIYLLQQHLAGSRAAA